MTLGNNILIRNPEKTTLTRAFLQTLLKMYSEVEAVIQKEFKITWSPAFRNYKEKLKDKLYVWNQNKKYHEIKN